MADSLLILPRYTLDLARRYWAPLLLVYLAGTLLHYVLLLAVVELGLRNEILGLLGVSAALLVTLTTTIVMFHLLRPQLPTLDGELRERAARSRGGAAPQRTSLKERERRIVDAVAMAILPFLVFYSAWGLISEEFRVYAVRASDEGGLGALAAVGSFDPLGLPLVTAVGALGLRILFERIYKRGNSELLGVCTALCEAVWIFFVVVSISSLISDGAEWLTGRVVWSQLVTGFSGVVATLAEVTSLPLGAGLAALASGLVWAWSLLKDGLMEPLLWLTIAAVIFGADVDSDAALFREHSRIGRIHRVASTHTPGVVARIADLAGHGWREKYLPFLNALKFILSVSPGHYLAFCLCYTLVELGGDWLHRGIFYAVGPAEFVGWWEPLLTPVGFAVEGVAEILRVCLLAAAFEITLRHAGGGTRRGARRADQLTP